MELYVRRFSLHTAPYITPSVDSLAIPRELAPLASALAASSRCKRRQARSLKLWAVVRNLAQENLQEHRLHPATCCPHDRTPVPAILASCLLERWTMRREYYDIVPVLNTNTPTYVLKTIFFVCFAERPENSQSVCSSKKAGFRPGHHFLCTLSRQETLLGPIEYRDNGLAITGFLCTLAAGYLHRRASLETRHGLENYDRITISRGK